MHRQVEADNAGHAVPPCMTDSPCACSILELPLDNVPNFIEATNPYESLHLFARSKRLGFLKIDCPDGCLPFPPSTADVDVPCVLAGPSPRGSHKHAVVGKANAHRLEPVFDP